MRASWLLPVVLLLAAVVTFVVWPGDDAMLLPDAPRVPAAPSAPTVAAVEQVDRDAVALPPVTPTAPPAGPAAAPATAAAPTPLATGNLRLVVRDAAGQRPIAAFRWRLRDRSTDTRGVGVDGDALLPASHDHDGELLIEADGCQPLLQAAVRGAAPGQAEVRLELFLLPAARGPGITLHVHDVSRQPILQLRVDAFALTAANRDAAWHLGPALWARRAAAADGRYELPELAPGEYGIRVTAADAEGRTLPLLPWSGRYTITGANSVVEDVTLEPGALLALELYDASGRAFDPARYGTTTFAMHWPGGAKVQRKWLSASGGGAAATAIDVLPGIGLAELTEAVPPGVYQFELFVNGEPRLQRSLTLVAGERKLERLVVP